MTDRLERALDALKAEFYAAGAEFRQTQDKALLHELHALTTAINVIEDYALGRRVTVITDSLG